MVQIMVNDNTFLAMTDITELIEASAFDPRLWDNVIDAIWQQLPGTRIVFQTRVQGMSGTSPILVRGWEDDHLLAYEAHYAALNPWVDLWASAPAMVPIWTEDTLPASSFNNSEFYCDWLSKVGEAECATGVKVMQENGQNASLDVHYGSQHADANHQRASRILRTIAPALRRSVSAMRLIHGSPTRNVLDLMLDAAFIVSEKGAVAALNAAAQELIDNGIVALVAPGGRLSVRSELADRELYREIAHIYNDRDGFASPTNTIRAASAREFLLISVFPVFHPASSQAGMGSLFHPRRKALVVVRMRPRSQKEGIDRFVARFGLTPAEARLVNALKHGLTLREAAQQNEISYETARGHLRSIFGKAGVQRQIDLVRLLISFDD